ncbi:hypothetical protein [Hyphococcus sp.]|uniref:hypothetical protein n=1 Tax=Hyphococcus sp. TaxID=2038636 RepID=UPI00208CB747|nr:MAG: hypothetical protein DHS20C04_24940 [Marinicaulis sp.]
MITRAFFLIALLLSSAAAFAADEPHSVRAGEHGEYSRLVIPQAPADWRIATSDRKIEITFPDKNYEFDLSDILDKRKAHRVLNARIVDTDKTRALVLTLTCDCPVRTSKSPENSIVVDIFNASPVTVAEDELEEERPISLDARNSQPQTPENMRAARDRMIALLAEARSQGVVQLKIDDERREEKQQAAQTAQAATDPTPASHKTEPTEEKHSTPAPDPHSKELREHAIDSALKPALAPAAPVTTHADGPPVLLTKSDHKEEDKCFDPALFNELKDEALDYSVISHLRQSFDLSDDEAERHEAASELAFAYLHFGFFEEASAIANPRGREGDADLAAAGALADIAIGSAARATRTLAPIQACGAFAEMAYAAAAKAEDENVAPMMEKHVEALRPVMAVLRAPLAETLALNAIDRGDTGIAKEFYDLARSARGRERSPALAVLENLLAEQIAASVGKTSGDHASAEQHAAAPAISDELKELAQEPGPMQAKALAILAKDYEKRADAAYEGLLDDIAAQSSRRNSSLSEARASFTGAKALVTAGRLHEGVAVLDSAAKAAPGASEASQKLAQSFIMNGLLADDKTRLDAVSTFFHFRDFVDAKDDGDLNIAVARELASYGANLLIDRALENTPESWRAQGDALRALSHLNSGDAHGALDLVNAGKKSADLSVVAVKAHERLNDRAGSVAVIKSAMRDGASDNELANAAWRAADWPLVSEAFTAVPKKDRETTAASRAALAALNAGANTLSPAVREALAKDPATLAALAHMFVSAPTVSIRAIDLLSEFAKGVTKETDFMERGLSAGGDGR